MKKNTLREKFEAFEEVRESGATNMFDLNMVEQLSGLERDDILDIMKNYDKYQAEYKEEE